MTNIIKHIWAFALCALLLCSIDNALAATYIVNTKANLQSKMNAALPGDTIIVSNGTYNNWGTINITNNNGTATSNWIVLKAQSFAGVVFTGAVNLQFAGKRILVSGFKFTNGNCGSTDVIQFRNSSSVSASYCRLNNIIIDNFNSDSTGSVDGTGGDTDNKWVSVYGTNNRVDHCTFINKFNAGATVTVWYDNNTYPNASTPTYHTIDSNYFKGRGYLGNNGGESMRLGTSTTSRTNAYNIVEYNLFEGCTQVEPEIISNKSNFNVYRYNTFKNCNGGLTLRHGRYCNVYGNYFIVNDNTYSKSYGVRVIDKGHKVYNNYFEGLLGNKNTLTSLRCPIILYNGLSSTNDTTIASKANGYFPADSTIFAFNTIVNCSGGAGLVLGYTDGGNNIYQPKGIIIANNLIKMASGQAAYIDAANSQLTYTAEGNMYNASSLGLTSSTGFTNNNLIFGTRTNGMLTPPSTVQDAAVNTASYTSLLNAKDVTAATRSLVYDVGALELNGSGAVIATPLDSNVVGAGKPLTSLPVRLVSFTAKKNIESVQLNWTVENEIDFRQFEVEYSIDGKEFKAVEAVAASQQKKYFCQTEKTDANQYYRLKLLDNDGTFSYSQIITLKFKTEALNFSVYPNPVKDFVNVSLDKSSKNIVVNIVNINGNAVKQVKATGNLFSISTQHLLNGLYNLQFIENNEIIQTCPIFISR